MRRHKRLKFTMQSSLLTSAEGRFCSCTLYLVSTWLLWHEINGPHRICYFFPHFLLWIGRGKSWQKKQNENDRNCNLHLGLPVNTLNMALKGTIHRCVYVIRYRQHCNRSGAGAEWTRPAVQTYHTTESLLHSTRWDTHTERTVKTWFVFSFINKLTYL